MIKYIHRYSHALLTEVEHVLLRSSLIYFTLLPTAKKKSWSKCIGVLRWDLEYLCSTGQVTSSIRVEHFLTEGLPNLQWPTLLSILEGLFLYCEAIQTKLIIAPLILCIYSFFEKVFIIERAVKTSYSVSHIAGAYTSWALLGIRGIKWLTYERDIILQATSVITEQHLKVSLTERKRCLHI